MANIPAWSTPVYRPLPRKPLRAPTRPTSTPPRASSITRRSLLPLLLLPVLPTATLATPSRETHESSVIHARITTPADWYVSGRRSTLLAVDLSRGLAATVCARAGALPNDAYGGAYEMIRERVEREGASIVITDAGYSGGLSFRFRSETGLPDGSVVVRVGEGRAVERGGREVVACVVTAPVGLSDGDRGVLKEVLDSLELI